MTRQLDREEAAATLTALNIFTGGVFDHALTTLGGATRIATVTSRGLELEGRTRGGGASLRVSQLLVSIYVRADQGAEAAAEDALDTLALDGALALAAAGWEVQPTTANPGGGILVNYDGALYRVERIPIQR